MSNLSRAASDGQMRERFLQWRGIQPDDACVRCDGAGRISYSNTSTWRHGIGGQAITPGVCDACWGSGDRRRPGVDLRKMIDTAGAKDARMLRICEAVDALDKNDASVDALRRVVEGAPRINWAAVAERLRTRHMEKGDSGAGGQAEIVLRLGSTQWRLIPAGRPITMREARALFVEQLVGVMRMMVWQ